jgi:hypothetical protein
MLKAEHQVVHVMVYLMNSFNKNQVNPARCSCTPTQRGFAYMWTLLLVAFMGVALVIASEIYSTTVTRDKERELIFIGREFRAAIARYYESNVAGGQRQYPLSIEDLLKDPRFPNNQRHLRRIYVDPMTGKNEWGTILVKGRIAGIYSLSDKAPMKQDNFEATEASFKGKKKYSEWAFTYPSDLLLVSSNNTVASDDAHNPAQSATPSTAFEKAPAANGQKTGFNKPMQ